MICGRAGWPFGLVLSLALISPGPASATSLPPYAPAMEELAEIMGSLQFLAELCEDDPAPWRAETEDMIALAEADEAWRIRLSDRFNLGYSSFAAAYRSCTESARAAIDHYRFLGAELAADIAKAFGNAPLQAPPAAPDG